MKISGFTSLIDRYQKINNQTGVNNASRTNSAQGIRETNNRINNRITKLLSSEERKHFKKVFPGLNFAYTNGVRNGKRTIKNKSVGLGRNVDIRA